MLENFFNRVIKILLTKNKVKLILLTFSVFISITVILYARYLSTELIDRETRTINFYAEIFRQYTDPRNQNTSDIDFYLYEIAPTIKFPVIMTDAEDNPLYIVDEFTNDTIYSTYLLNIDLDTKLPPYKQREYLIKLIKEMGAIYEPITIEIEDMGIILQKLYYSHSKLVDYLRYFPILTIIVMGIFVFIGYMAFDYFRKNEESKVWVGMSKEAAHQLGTPLSSLLAWIEVLKININDPQKIDEILNEMQKDINRLETITVRFSKIGSLPEMNVKNLALIIDEVCNYFEKRLPHLGTKIEIKRFLESNVFAEINEDLFKWVMENLFKNAVEAIDNKKGQVEIHLTKNNKKVSILVKDNGKGMSLQTKRQAFYPGFTTKKRGWGLGLSLTKRIIEDYHKGKIFIKETSPGKGTVFQIDLPEHSFET